MNAFVKTVVFLVSNVIGIKEATRIEFMRETQNAICNIDIDMITYSVDTAFIKCYWYSYHFRATVCKTVRPVLSDR